MNRHFTLLIVTFTSAKVGDVFWHCVFVQILPWLRVGFWYWVPGIKKRFYITTKPWHMNIMAFPIGITFNLNHVAIGPLK